MVIDRHYPGDSTAVITSDHKENARLLTAAVMASGARDMAFSAATRTIPRSSRVSTVFAKPPATAKTPAL
nr:hypothetical protein [Marinicella sp. W31]MDC2878362.1 hypothetical protein [Marinicella sp. W31]